MNDAAIDYQRAAVRRLKTWFGAIVQRGTVTAAGDGVLLSVQTYDGNDLGTLARLRGPQIVAGDTVYVLNVSGDPRHPANLVLGAEGPGEGYPHAGSDARSLVSYGGAATVLGSPVVTFTGLRTTRAHRVEAWATSLVSPNSGQDCYLAVVIGNSTDAGAIGDETPQLSTSSKGGLGAGHVRDIPAGPASIAVALQIRTDAGHPAAMDWTDLRLFARCVAV